MAIEFAILPYAVDALEPHISRETIEFHYGKHYKAYVSNLNTLITSTKFFGKTLEFIVKNSCGNIFNNAAQAWNHSFYWQCLAPDGGGEPTGKLLDAIKQSFDSLASFKTQFIQAAVSLFGSGWVWLIINVQGKLELISTNNAGIPLVTYHVKPLLICDIWEHAYYIDYRNARLKYIEAYWQLINWKFVQENLVNR